MVRSCTLGPIIQKLLESGPIGGIYVKTSPVILIFSQDWESLNLDCYVSSLNERIPLSPLWGENLIFWEWIKRRASDSYTLSLDSCTFHKAAIWSVISCYHHNSFMYIPCWVHVTEEWKWNSKRLNKQRFYHLSSRGKNIPILFF